MSLPYLRTTRQSSGGKALSLQFGIWSPVCGGWLRIINHEADSSIQYLIEVAAQADRLGYDFYYIPEHYLNAVHGPTYEVTDAWLTAAAVSLNTQRIKIVAATQPGFKLPAVVAKLAADLQNQLSHGRFGLSGIAGWWKLEAEAYGDVWLSHSDRYSRLEEYLHVIMGMWSGEVFSYVGNYYTQTEGLLAHKPVPLPFIFVAGESNRAIDLAARKADYLFINADSLEKTAALVQRVKQLARDRYNRTVKVAMSAFAIVRETTAEAEARLEQIYRLADQQKIDYFQNQIDSNVIAHNKLNASQTIEANLGLSAQLIGDPDVIISRLREFESIGVDLLMLKFELMLNDTERFYESVISKYAQQNDLVRL
jgi:FMNH2-dependent dimethyl sulfone monooxygenase